MLKFVESLQKRCPGLAIKTSEWRYWHYFGVFIVDIAQIVQIYVQTDQ